MRHKGLTHFILLIGLLAGWMVPAVYAAEPGVAVTIYNDNFGVVKERREMSFEQGINQMQFTDVASAIDPTSVYFKCLSDPDAVSILEQNYEYDLVNTASLLKRYIDKPVRILVKGSGDSEPTWMRGKLMASLGSDLILEEEGGMLSILGKDTIQNIMVEKMPQDLVIKPTLVWLANAQTGGSKLCEVTYTTDSINWKADYMAVVNPDDTKLELSGWVTINNQSGTGYEDATLKLIAGDVRRVQPPQPKMPRDRGVMYEMAQAGDAGFEEKAFMEYHMYTLGRKSTINNNQVKQIELIEPVSGVPVEKKYVYEVSESYRGNQNGKVQVKLEFENKEEYGLGMPLPMGKIRVFKNDPADDTLEFVGEDTIDHTPSKEELSLYIGDAFDIVVEAEVADSKQGERWGENWRRLTYELEIRNRKDEDVLVHVDHRMSRWGNTEIEENNFPYEKMDAYRVRFAVPVDADDEETLTYTYTVRW